MAGPRVSVTPLCVLLLLPLLAVAQDYAPGLETPVAPDVVPDGMVDGDESFGLALPPSPPNSRHPSREKDTPGPGDQSPPLPAPTSPDITDHLLMPKPGGAPTPIPPGASTPKPDGAPTPKPDGAPTPKPDGAPTLKPDGAPPPIRPGAPTPKPDGAPTPKPDGAPTPKPDGAPMPKPDGAPPPIPPGAPPPKPGGAPPPRPAGAPPPQRGGPRPGRPGGSSPSRPGRLAPGRPGSMPPAPPKTDQGWDPERFPSEEPPIGLRTTTTALPFQSVAPRKYRLSNSNNDPSLGRVEAFNEGEWHPVCSTFRWSANDAKVLCRQLGYDNGVPSSSAHYPQVDFEKMEEEERRKEEELEEEEKKKEEMEEEEEKKKEEMEEEEEKKKEEMEEEEKKKEEMEEEEEREKEKMEEEEERKEEMEEEEEKKEKMEEEEEEAEEEKKKKEEEKKKKKKKKKEEEKKKEKEEKKKKEEEEASRLKLARPRRVQRTAVKLVFNCAGKEQKLPDCPGKWIDYCYTNVGAICFSNETSKKGIEKVRIVPPVGKTATKQQVLGKVEVFHRGFWGTICEKEFKTEEATSVCQKVGYRYGYKVPRNTISMQSSDNPITWLSQFDCSDVTTDLLSCTKYKPGEFTGCASHYYDAIVMCLNTAKPFGELEVQNLRLTKTTQGANWLMGRVEVQVAGSWGTVCDKRRYAQADWTDTHAAIVCRQLGYGSGIYVKPSVFGSDNQTVWFYKRQCPEDATSLNECTSKALGDYDCKESGPGVFCFSKDVVDDCEISLLERPAANPPPGRRPPPGLLPPPGSKPPPAQFGGEDPDLDMQPAPTKPTRPLPMKCKTGVRIVGSPEVDPALHVKAGRVEFYNMGLWGPICADGFDDRAAHVICRSLQFRTGRAMLNSSFGVGDGPTWLSNVNCQGNEKLIFDCLTSRNTLLGNPSCSKKHQAGVICEDDEDEDAETVPVRLVNKKQASLQIKTSGVVEVLYKGYWGTICSTGWDDEDAQVVCRQLGFLTGYVTVNHGLVSGDRPVWLEGVQCDGTEMNIKDCAHSGWALKSMYAICSHANDAGVICFQHKKKKTKSKAAIPAENKNAPQHSLSKKTRALDSGTSRIVHSAVTTLVCVTLTTVFAMMK